MVQLHTHIHSTGCASPIITAAQGLNDRQPFIDHPGADEMSGYLILNPGPDFI
jgi:hypothetical protein